MEISIGRKRFKEKTGKALYGAITKKNVEKHWDNTQNPIDTFITFLYNNR